MCSFGRQTSRSAPEITGREAIDVELGISMKVPGNRRCRSGKDLDAFRADALRDFAVTILVGSCV